MNNENLATGCGHLMPDIKPRSIKNLRDWWAWCVPRLIVLTAAGLLILVLATASSKAILWFENRPKTVSSYADISIGMNRAEVAYRKGTPKGVSRPPTPEEIQVCQSSNPPFNEFCADWLYEPADNAKINDFPEWMWNLGNASFNVRFDSQGEVEQIRCYDTVSESRSECPRIFSIGIGTKESEILIRLGTPSYEKIDPDSYVKTLSFDRLNLSFFLKQGKIYMVTVTKDLS